MTPTTGSKNNIALKRIALAASIALLLGCLSILILPFFLTSQHNAYPNATTLDACAPDGPTFKYYPNIVRLVVANRKIVCTSTPDAVSSVLTFYRQHGWPLQTLVNGGSGYLITAYEAGPFYLMILRQMDVSSHLGATEIYVTTGFQLNIGGP